MGRRIEQRHTRSKARASSSKKAGCHILRSHKTFAAAFDHTRKKEFVNTNLSPKIVRQREGFPGIFQKGNKNDMHCWYFLTIKQLPIRDKSAH
jgi:hypothetical protein